jgi:hypothetical protein
VSDIAKYGWNRKEKNWQKQMRMYSVSTLLPPLNSNADTYIYIYILRDTGMTFQIPFPYLHPILISGELRFLFICTIYLPSDNSRYVFSSHGSHTLTHPFGLQLAITKSTSFFCDYKSLHFSHWVSPIFCQILLDKSCVLPTFKKIRQGKKSSSPTIWYNSLC